MLEQQCISDFLDERTGRLPLGIANLNTEIALLQEYRTRLVSDVVTGKLDVRGFARSLPDDISEEAAEISAAETLDEDLSTDDALLEDAV